MDLNQLYKQAAQAADADGISAGDQDALVAWIRSNVRYRPDTEFFIALGIGCELADIQSVRRGYKNQVDEAFQNAVSACRAKGMTDRQIFGDRAF
jgi:hypothetical protein